MENRKAYFKEGKEVAKPRYVVIDGKTYVPPTDEQIIKAGYEIKEVEKIVYNSPTYEEKVVQLIRQRYDIDAELAILRQRDSKPEEFAEYNNYCEECKNKIKAM